MDRNPRILIVCEDATRTKIWSDWLARAGYETYFCAGPSLAPCPRTGTGRCALREVADCAVVEVQGPDEAFPHGEWLARACTKLPDDHSTIYVSDHGGPGDPELHLSHPVTPGTLIGKVEDVLSRLPV